jgi:hypothetical protein
LEIFDLDIIDLESIPGAHLGFDPIDAQRKQVPTGSLSDAFNTHAIQPHAVVSLSSVAEVAAGKHNVSANPK